MLWFLTSVRDIGTIVGLMSRPKFAPPIFSQRSDNMCAPISLSSAVTRREFRVVAEDVAKGRGQSDKGEILEIAENG